MPALAGVAMTLLGAGTEGCSDFPSVYAMADMTDERKCRRRQRQKQFD